MNNRCLIVVTGLLATVAVLAAGCGGDPKRAGVANLPGTTATTAARRASHSGSGSLSERGLSEGLQFARCMRSHGVPNYPDPPTNPNEGQLQNIQNAGVNTRTPIYQSALQACEKYSPAASLTPAQRATENARGLEFTQCMRAHGVPNYPDPITGPDGAAAINLGPEHIDPRSPIVQAANQACQKVVAGAK